jgi:hypothetical protein
MQKAQDENGILLIVIVILVGLCYGIYRILRGPRD